MWSVDYGYDLVGHLTSARFDSANGTLTSNGTNTHGYDAEDRLSGATRRRFFWAP